MSLKLQHTCYNGIKLLWITKPHYNQHVLSKILIGNTKKWLEFSTPGYKFNFLTSKWISGTRRIWLLCSVFNFNNEMLSLTIFCKVFHLVYTVGSLVFGLSEPWPDVEGVVNIIICDLKLFHFWRWHFSLKHRKQQHDIDLFCREIFWSYIKYTKTVCLALDLNLV